MKWFCLLAAATGLLCVPASATPFAIDAHCASNSCSLPQQQNPATSSAVSFNSAMQDTLGLTASLPTAILASSNSVSFGTSSATSSTGFAPSVAADTQNQADFFVQHASLVSFSSPSDAANLVNFFSANAVTAELRGEHSGAAKGATATAEPSTLLLLSFGLLLFVPFLRKHRSGRRAHHLRHA
jgi:hypothetical protein